MVVSLESRFLEIAHFESFLRFWQLTCFNIRSHSCAPPPRPPLPCVLAAQNTSHCVRWEFGKRRCFAPTLLQPRGRSIPLPGSAALPALSTQQRVTLHKEKTIGFLSSQMLLGLVNALRNEIPVSTFHFLSAPAVCNVSQPLRFTVTVSCLMEGCGSGVKAPHGSVFFFVYGFSFRK